MRRLGLVGLCIAAGFVTAGVASASAAPPEFGRCVKVAVGTGVYATRKCTSEGGEKKFDWIPGPGPKPGFTEAISGEKAFKWKLATNEEGICTAESATGEYTGPKTVGHVHIVFSGCGWIVGGEPVNAPCENIVLAPMAGELGVYLLGATPEENKLGLKLAPEAGEELASFNCGAYPHMWRGGFVIDAFPANVMMLKGSLAYKQKHGPGYAEEQIPASFVGETPDPLEEIHYNCPEGCPMGWQMTTKLFNEEKLEANSVL